MAALVAAIYDFVCITKDVDGRHSPAMTIPRDQDLLWPRVARMAGVGSRRLHVACPWQALSNDGLPA
jgi:hypothetical protein